MMRSLVVKFSLAFLLVSLVGIALVAFFAGRVSANEFNNFADAQSDSLLMNQLVNYYEATGSWDNLNRIGIGGVGPTSSQTRPFLVVDTQRKVVLSGLGQEVGERVPRGWLNRGVPIEVGSEVVGLLIFPETRMHNGSMMQPPRNDFSQRVNVAIFLAAVGATAVSLLLGVLVSRSLTRPIQEITRATQAVAQGNLAQQVPVRTDDELGRLATAFNKMSADLAQSRDLRRQMTADIAHDLRTPLSLILGHAEALSDGVLPPTPETFDVIHDEARRLNRLVEDLRLLSLAEAGELPVNLQLVPPHELLERAVAAHLPAAQQKAIQLDMAVTPNLPAVQVDPDRLAQVLDNLVGNALRYTPENGRVQLSASQNDGSLQLKVQDSGPGMSEADLSHVFDRFYRGDKARQRHDGGSGLGLAIARSIVINHNGRIWAESSPGKGATFIIELPQGKLPPS